jgi:hypothetical protein
MRKRNDIKGKVIRAGIFIVLSLGTAALLQVLGQSNFDSNEARIRGYTTPIATVTVPYNGNNSDTRIENNLPGALAGSGNRLVIDLDNEGGSDSLFSDGGLLGNRESTNSAQTIDDVIKEAEQHRNKNTVLSSIDKAKSSTQIGLLNEKPNQKSINYADKGFGGIVALVESNFQEDYFLIIKDGKNKTIILEENYFGQPYSKKVYSSNDQIQSYWDNRALMELQEVHPGPYTVIITEGPLLPTKEEDLRIIEWGTFDLNPYDFDADNPQITEKDGYSINVFRDTVTIKGPKINTTDTIDVRLYDRNGNKLPQLYYAGGITLIQENPSLLFGSISFKRPDVDFLVEVAFTKGFFSGEVLFLRGQYKGNL